MRVLIERVCTPKEVAALKLYDPPRVGYRTLGALLSVSSSTARDRVQRALSKVGRELNAAGRE